MNRNIIKVALTVLVSMPLLAGCELDQEPYNALTNEASWQTFDNVQSQYVGLKSALRSVSGGSNAYITEIQSDLFNARAGSAAYNQVHNWTFTGNESQSNTEGVWSNNFALVKQANEMLTHIDPFIVAQPKSTAEVSQNIQAYYYKAMSYFSIAYAYANMVVRYCKDYEPETASQTLGMPLVQPYDNVESKPARATLVQTDTFITNRIDSAYKYLDLAEAVQDAANLEEPVVSVDGTLHEAGRNALKALESRYDLYTHRFDQAIEKSKELIDNGSYQLENTKNGLVTMWALDESKAGEIIYEPMQTSDEQMTSYATIWVSYDIRNGSLYGANPFYFPTQGLLDLYEDGDLRKSVYFTNPYYSPIPCSGTGDIQENGSQFWKFPTNTNLLKNPDSEWYSKIFNMTKAFRIAEQYLIVAEASLRKATPDEATAREYLNLLRESRSATPIADDVTGEALLKDMQDEWTREFVGEGFRLDCLKRWHEGFKRMTPQAFNSALLINSKGYTDLEVKADNKRFVWEIPQQELQANKNMKSNWSE